MIPYSPTPSSGTGRSGRGAAARSGGKLYMSPRQAEAYLLARDAVRRIQRTTSLVSGIAQHAAAQSLKGQQGGERQNH